MAVAATLAACSGWPIFCHCQLQKQALTCYDELSQRTQISIGRVRKAVVTVLSSLFQPCGLVTINPDGLLSRDLIMILIPPPIIAEIYTNSFFLFTDSVKFNFACTLEFIKRA